MEKKRYLVQVRDGLFADKPLDERKNILTPFLLVAAGDTYNRRTLVKGNTISWLDCLFVPESLAILNPFAFVHPPVVEINDVLMRTIVGVEYDRLAYTFGKVVGELKDVPHRCTTKTIDGLIAS